jgi:hypothetical protein
MSHEIYYTSAPEGLKRGSSGFCTVAASENIPRALWDRLESLSAYRHQFSVNADEGKSASGSGRNPVSQAHWILSVVGKTYHVLSRICDSGVDHTQRTNAFAHHLVVESSELEAAQGGPAWMLGQPGVMAAAWDGRVGAIGHAALPRGDAGGAGICRAWEEATGDAGGGGHLADLFSKSPTRPVCILFRPGQELLPMLAESIRLLPPALRWNITFNTYFTSMPTSATCLWRCCLAGTPAAQLGLRYAANGLVLDLTELKRLPPLPPGPLVTVARTGQAAVPPVVAGGAKAPGARPVTGAAAAQRPRAGGGAAGGAGSALAGAGKNSPQAPAAEEEEEEEVERQRRAFFEGIPERGEERETSATDAQERGGSPGKPGGAQATYDIAPLPAGQEGAAISAPVAGERIGKPPRISPRKSHDTLRQVQEDAAAAAGRRRRQVMWLFGGALAAIAGGSALVWVAYHHNAPPTPAADSGSGAVPALRSPVQREPIAAIPAESPSAPSTPGPGAEERAPSPVAEVPLPIPASPGPVSEQPAQAPAVIAVPSAPVFPETVTLASLLERPKIGNGIGDFSQALSFRGGDLDPAPISGLRIRFPAPPAGGRSRALPPDNVYVSETLGTLAGKPENRGMKPGLAITWKAAGDPGFPGEVLYLSLDRNRATLELQWHTAALLKNAQMLPVVYWLLQNSSLSLQSTRAGSQELRFKAIVPPPLMLGDAVSTITWPVEPPPETTVTAPRLTSLPHGWEASVYPDWESREMALRSPANVSQVVKFKKPTTTAEVDAWFLITVRPGFTKVESTFGKRLAADQAELARCQGELRGIDQEIDEAKKINGGILPESEGGLALMARRTAAASRVDAYKAAVAAYTEMPPFDIGLDLPDGLRVASLHFQQTSRTSETGK